MVREKIKTISKRNKKKNIWIKRSVSVSILSILIIFIIYLIYLGFKWTKNQFFKNNPRFEIQYIHFDTNGRVSEGLIREQLANVGVTNGANLFSFEFNKVEDQLSKIPYIKSIYLERDIPNALRIKINERNGIAILEGNTSSRREILIDHEGFTFPSTLQSHKTLPHITGYPNMFQSNIQVHSSDINLALNIISICNSSIQYKQFMPIKEIDISNQDYIQIRLTDGLLIHIDRASLKNKLEEVLKVIMYSKGSGQVIRKIDSSGSRTIARP